MLKTEIKLDHALILSSAKYSEKSIYDMLDETFGKYGFMKTELEDGTICYKGNGNAGDYGSFGRLITTLKNKEWFMPYLTKWLWYNSDDGENEDDFTIEDVLYHYTQRESVA